MTDPLLSWLEFVAMVGCVVLLAFMLGFDLSMIGLDLLGLLP